MSTSEIDFSSPDTSYLDKSTSDDECLPHMPDTRPRPYLFEPPARQTAAQQGASHSGNHSESDHEDERLGNSNW